MTRKTFSSFLVAFVISAVSVAGVLAQSQRPTTADKFIITAKAGGINFVQGPVSVARKNGKGGLLMRGDSLEIGDRISTDERAKVEVLLNPGSYLRLAGNSESEFISTDLDDLQIKLHRGSAMFEVFATNEFRVNVTTPAGRVAFIESGVYRIDLKDGSGTVAVTEGKAELGDTMLTKVKAGRVAQLDGKGTIAKFDRDKRDEMGEWSRSRAKELAKMSASIKQKDIRSSLMSSYRIDRWSIYDSFGLWVYNSALRGYSFLPFGNSWYSPYGYGFGWGMDWSNFYWNFYRSYPNATPVKTAVGGGIGGESTTAPPGKVRRLRGPVSAPPFAHVEKSAGRQTGFGNSDNGGFRDGGGRGGFDRISAPPAQAAPPISSTRVDPISAGGRKSSPID
jgi:hypothetical protein